MTVRLALIVLLIPALAACSGGLPAAAADTSPGPVATGEATPADSPSPTRALVPTISPRPRPTDGLTPTPFLAPTPLLTPTDSACAPAAADPELLRLVDREHGLGRDYLPADLEELELNPRNVYLKPQYFRRAATAPLLALLGAMNAAGLRPRVISGYRSYV
ncbi:MAG: hypothetical protein HY784_02775, partial [Chloroflexi bacterium]|nr:hypothetical protein [Chloroflexota bacterium]